MRTIKVIVIGLLFSLFMCSTAFAANASLDGAAEKTAKGRTIDNKTLIVNVGAGEVNAMSDTITVTLEGAEWTSMKSGTQLAKGITCDKVSTSVIALHITPDEGMLKNGLSIKIPLNCRVTANLSNIKAIVNWGLPEYIKWEVTIAKCDVSYAYRDGRIKEHKKGDKIYQKGSSTSYNELKIAVLGADAESMNHKITVTLDGAEWSDYKKQGKVTCNYSAEARFIKKDDRTIEIEFTNFSDKTARAYYTLTLPLTGTITGTGEIKAIVDYGGSGTPQSTVVFARCLDGTVTVSCEDPKREIDLRGELGDITITDTSTQGYPGGTKFVLKPNFSYRFTEVPILECTGKFDGNCRAEINKNDEKQCIITLNYIPTGSDGTITLKAPVIERPEVNVPNRPDIKLTLEASGWEDYTSTIKVGTYKAGAAYFQPNIRVTTNNPHAQANDKYAFLGKIIATDISAAAYKEGDKIEISFDSGFVWFTEGNPPALTASGKFKDRCSFTFDKSAPEKAYIVFTADIPAEEGGTIELNNSVAKKTTDTKFEKVKMTAGLVSAGKDTYNTVQAAKFSSLLTREPETTTEAPSEATTESTPENTSEPVTDTNTIAVKFTALLKFFTNT